MGDYDRKKSGRIGYEEMEAACASYHVVAGSEA
jgi:hypothetical protein